VKANAAQAALCRNQNGNEEIGYNMLWSGAAYSKAEAAAKAAKEKYKAAA